MEWVRLGDVASKITKGTTPTSVGFNFVDEGINFIKAESISENGEFIENKFDHISNKCNEKLARSQLQENDILFSIAGVIGRTAIVKKEILPANTNQALAIIRVPTGIFDYSFLMYALKSPLIIGQYEKQKQGVAQINLSLQNVSDFRIPKLSLADQRHIAAVLDRVSDLIAQRRAQLDKLDLLVKSRFVEMFGDLSNPNCPYKKYKLVDVCADSDDIKCGPFGTQLSKQEYQDHGVALWEIPQINSCFSTPPTHFLTQEKAAQLNAFSIVPGDIVMSRKGNVGRCALFPSYFENGIMHSDVLRIRVDKHRVNPCFMMYQLHFSRAVQHQIEAVSTGAIMAGVNVTKLKNIVIRLPDLDQQESFCRFVQKKDTLKNSINKSLEYLETLKQSLMQQYFE